MTQRDTIESFRSIRERIRTSAVELVRRMPQGSIWQTRYLCLPFVIIISTVVLSHSQAGILSRALWFLAGAGTWTFLEYILHRFVLHYHPKSAVGAAMLDRLHVLHHNDPKDESQVCVPFVLSLPVWGTIFAVILVFGGAWDRGLIFTCGLALMMVVYDIAHYSAHYMKASNGLLRIIKQHHLLHHFSDHRKRFGVTSPMWDYVFGTSK